MNPLLETHRAAIADACRKFRVDRLAAFGSIVREDFEPRRSDVDLIVRFQAADQPGYADRYMDFAETLEGFLGRPVELLTERALRNPILRREIEREAVVLYEDSRSQAA